METGEEPLLPRAGPWEARVGDAGVVEVGEEEAAEGEAAEVVEAEVGGGEGADHAEEGQKSGRNV